MLSVCRRLLNRHSASFLQKCADTTYGASHIIPSCNPNYEGDGKTTVSVLNNDSGDLLLIDTFSSAGFRLNNNIFVVGPIAIFPKTILQWNVESMETLTPEAFSLFELIEPRLDILIIGSGETLINLNENCINHLRKHKIYYELLPTKDAIPVFNYLNMEGRNLASVLFPTERSIEDDDISTQWITMARRGQLFRATTNTERDTQRQEDELREIDKKWEQLEDRKEEIDKIHAGEQPKKFDDK